MRTRCSYPDRHYNSAANMRCLTWHVLSTPWYVADSLFILLPSFAASSAKSFAESTDAREAKIIYRKQETGEDSTRQLQ